MRQCRRPEHEVAAQMRRQLGGDHPRPTSPRNLWTGTLLVRPAATGNPGSNVAGWHQSVICCFRMDAVPGLSSGRSLGLMNSSAAPLRLLLVRVPACAQPPTAEATDS